MNDGKLYPLAYASRSLSQSKKNYAITELETLSVVWAVSNFRYYLYGNKVTVYTDHTAVKAVLGNLNGKHARWWSRMYGSGIREIDIVFRAGKHDSHADASSRQPTSPTSDENCNEEMQVALITSENDSRIISTLLNQCPTAVGTDGKDFADEQRDDEMLQTIILYLEENKLPEDLKLAQEIVTESTLFTLSDGILYFVGHKKSDMP